MAIGEAREWRSPMSTDAGSPEPPLLSECRVYCENEAAMSVSVALSPVPSLSPQPLYPCVVCVLLIWTGPQRALVVVSSHRQRGSCRDGEQSDACLSQ